MEQGTEASSEAWLALMHALLPRLAISQALRAALSEPPVQAGAICRPLVTAALTSLRSCFDSLLEVQHASSSSTAAAEDSMAVMHRLRLPQAAVRVLAVMLQLQLHPLLRWLLSQAAVSPEPGLSHRLVMLLHHATGCCSGALIQSLLLPLLRSRLDAQCCPVADAHAVRLQAGAQGAEKAVRCTSLHRPAEVHITII